MDVVLGDYALMEMICRCTGNDGINILHWSIERDRCSLSAHIVATTSEQGTYISISEAIKLTLAIQKLLRIGGVFYSILKYFLVNRKLWLQALNELGHKHLHLTLQKVKLTFEVSEE
ncbi:unnamed protein product [Lactuca saligna]|uniref:Uncharacterized protein n=1 Tax=Lactuca saligna TaxID=75948 RepID=A0AA35VKE1_LACSI|nr:unnamed protein product [Lactuca saligna]